MEWYKLPWSHQLLFIWNEALYHSCLSSLAAHRLGGPSRDSWPPYRLSWASQPCAYEIRNKNHLPNWPAVEWKLEWHFLSFQRLALNKVIMKKSVRRQTKPSTTSCTCVCTRSVDSALPVGPRLIFESVTAMPYGTHVVSDNGLPKIHQMEWEIAKIALHLLQVVFLKNSKITSANLPIENSTFPNMNWFGGSSPLKTNTHIIILSINHLR